MKNENRIRTIKQIKIMITLKRYLLTLVALLAMTTGAWAQTQITITQDFEDGMGDWTMNHCEGNTGIKSGFAYEGSNCFRFYYTTNYPQYLISPELDENDGGTMSFYYARESSNYIESFKVGYSTTTSEPSAFTWGNQQTVSNGDGGDFFDYTYNFPAGTKYVSIACTSPDQFYLFIDDIKIEYAPAGPAAGTVTISDDQTEASFAMPAYDATVSYQLVRDMQDATNPVAFSGIPTDGKIFVKKGDDGKYQPAEDLNIQLIDPLIEGDDKNIIGTEGITIKVLVGDDSTGPVEYDQENPITLDAFLADMKPGFYWIKAVATTDGAYDGTVYSTEMWLAEAYDLTLSPATDANLQSVTVAGTAKTADENGVIRGIEPTKKVKITTTGPDYIIRKAAVKKTVKQ